METEPLGPGLSSLERSRSPGEVALPGREEIPRKAKFGLGKPRLSFILNMGMEPRVGRDPWVTHPLERSHVRTRAYGHWLLHL